MANASRFPTAFVAHGSPTLALDTTAGEPFRRWGERLARPSAILVVSAHYDRAPLTIGTTETRDLMYDFFGFPAPLYRVQYPAPGAPWLADRLIELLPGREVQRSTRPLDHGVWSPLVHMVPAADIPVLQISMPHTDKAADLFALGHSLAPLRDEGVFLLASGNLVHNLGRLDWTGKTTPPTWARDFDDWIAGVLRTRDWDQLIDYRDRAPALRLAHPTEEHLRPVLVAAGAAADDEVRFVLESWEFGSLSRRSVQFG